ncbi:hypothetical protein ACQY1Q_09270 [Tenacibaculum sp. TC6]|uniref:hypothetical protein n=1 Tax=Tenacibaculum sp. TC6 TaxID=3423223 RepID=UPI003D36F932
MLELAVIKVIHSLGVVILVQIATNCLDYEWSFGLARNFGNTHQTENPLEFSEVSENEQFLYDTLLGIFFLIT